jgi:predicted phosphodiesterase
LLVTSADYKITKPFLKFLQVQCHNFQHVFLVLGNHEFYGITRDEGLQLAAKLTQESVLQGRLVLLNCDRFDFPGENITLLGCTLHSHISRDSRNIVQSKVKDFSCILEWTVDRHNRCHGEDLSWLKGEIDSIRNQERTNQTGTRNPRKKIVVVTHHAPIRKGSSAPENENNDWSDAFATELLTPGTKKIANPLLDVDWFVFGHTHFTTSCTRGSVRLISNQRGYVFPGQQRNLVDGGGTSQRKNSSTVPVAKKQRSLFLARLLRRGNHHTKPEPRFQQFDIARCIHHSAIK